MPLRKRAGTSGFMGALRGQRLCSCRAPSSLNPSILTISLHRVTYPSLLHSRHCKVKGKYYPTIISHLCDNQEERPSQSYIYMVPIFVRLRAEWRIRFLLLFVHHFLPSDRSLAHAAMKNWIFRVCAAGERSTTGRHATINVPRLKMVTVHFSSVPLPVLTLTI